MWYPFESCYPAISTAPWTYRWLSIATKHVPHEPQTPAAALFQRTGNEGMGPIHQWYRPQRTPNSLGVAKYERAWQNAIKLRKHTKCKGASFLAMPRSPEFKLYIGNPVQNGTAPPKQQQRPAQTCGWFFKWVNSSKCKRINLQLSTSSIYPQRVANSSNHLTKRMQNRLTVASSQPVRSKNMFWH